MDIRIASKNIAMNPQTETYIQRKFDRLERHLPSISDAKVEISKTSSRAQSDRIIAEITLVAGGYTLRGQESGLNVFAAIDSVADVMDRQIRRYKTRTYRSSRGRKSARTEMKKDQAELIAADDSIPDDGDLHDFGTVVRTKRFAMEPMTLDDAITEMELLNHGFFLFFNSDSKEFNVLYRRDDGDYGVIEPELA